MQSCECIGAGDLLTMVPIGAGQASIGPCLFVLVTALDSNGNIHGSERTLTADGLEPRDRRAVSADSGRPRAAEWPGGWQRGRRAPVMRQAGESPCAAAMPGATEVAGAPYRSGMGLKLPGSFRGDGLGNHWMHDILLACGTTLFGALMDIVLEGYDSLAASNSSVRSLGLGMPPPGSGTGAKASARPG